MVRDCGVQNDRASNAIASYKRSKYGCNHILIRNRFWWSF